MHALHCGVFIWMYHVENDWGNSKKAKMTRVKSGSESAGMWKSVRQMNLLGPAHTSTFLSAVTFVRDVTNIMDIVLSFTPSLLLHVPRSVQLSTTTCEPSCQNRGWLHTWRCCFFYLSLFLVLLGIQTAHFLMSCNVRRIYRRATKV